MRVAPLTDVRPSSKPRRRQSTANAYLWPVMPGPNLIMAADALARKITVRGGRCTGVEYSAAGNGTVLPSHAR